MRVASTTGRRLQSALCAKDSGHYRSINLDLMARKPSLLEHQYAKESFNRSSFSIVANPGGAILRCRTGKSHVTSEQVTRAVQELEKLAQQKITKRVPGLAIAVVFQDKSCTRKDLACAM